MNIITPLMLILQLNIYLTHTIHNNYHYLQCCHQIFLYFSIMEIRSISYQQSIIKELIKYNGEFMESKELIGIISIIIIIIIIKILSLSLSNQMVLLISTNLFYNPINLLLNFKYDLPTILILSISIQSQNTSIIHLI